MLEQTGYLYLHNYTPGQFYQFYMRLGLTLALRGYALMAEKAFAYAARYR